MPRSDSSTFPWSIAVSVYGDEHVMEANLARSPALALAAQVLVQPSFNTVVAAYNDALDKCTSDVLVFAHPDVYLPWAWAGQLQEALAWLQERDPGWGVLGHFGCDASGAGVGFAYSVGLGSLVGTALTHPATVRTVDEFIFIVRKSSGLRFDESLPGPQSQLCAPDICLQAARGGMGVYVIPAFAVHNSNGWSYLPMNFWRPYLYMRRKWREALPIAVPYAQITGFCTPMIRNAARALRKRRSAAHRTRTRVDDIVAHYETLRAGTIHALGGADAPLGATRGER